MHEHKLKKSIRLNSEIIKLKNLSDKKIQDQIEKIEQQARGSNNKTLLNHLTTYTAKIRTLTEKYNSEKSNLEDQIEFNEENENSYKMPANYPIELNKNEALGSSQIKSIKSDENNNQILYQMPANFGEEKNNKPKIPSPKTPDSQNLSQINFLQSPSNQQAGYNKDVNVTINQLPNRKLVETSPSSNLHQIPLKASTTPSPIRKIFHVPSSSDTSTRKSNTVSPSPKYVRFRDHIDENSNKDDQINVSTPKQRSIIRSPVYNNRNKNLLKLDLTKISNFNDNLLQSPFSNNEFRNHIEKERSTRDNKAINRITPYSRNNRSENNSQIRNIQQNTFSNDNDSDNEDLEALSENLDFQLSNKNELPENSSRKSIYLKSNKRKRDSKEDFTDSNEDLTDSNEDLTDSKEDLTDSKINRSISQSNK